MIVDHKTLNLSDTELVAIYRDMLCARKLDERVWLLNRAGKIPFTVSCQGHEAVGVGAAWALNREQDWLCPYYRDLGMVLSFGQTVKELMLSYFAKAADPNSGGRQMPAHFSDRHNRIFTGSSPVGTQLLHAAGIAYAAKLKQEQVVVLASCGEGTTSEGDWHEACNFAGVHKLPVIFVVENNQYAISVPLSLQIAGGNIATRAQGYGFPGLEIDGNDPLVVYQAVSEAAKRARAGEGPTLIEAKVHRLQPHSSDDDDKRYRAAEEIMIGREEDPLKVFRDYLLAQTTFTAEADEELTADIMLELDEAVTYAEQSPPPQLNDMYKYVFGTEGL